MPPIPTISGAITPRSPTPVPFPPDTSSVSDGDSSIGKDGNSNVNVQIGDKWTFNPSTSGPFEGQGVDHLGDEDFNNNTTINKDRGGPMKIHPGAIVAIVVSVVILIALATGYCVYKDRKRKQIHKEHHLRVKAAAQMRTVNNEVAFKEAPVPVVVPAAASAIPRVNDDDLPPPYEAAHLTSRHPGAVHQWDPRREAEEDITAMGAMVTDGIPPERKGAGGGLGIGV